MRLNDAIQKTNGANTYSSVSPGNLNRDPITKLRILAVLRRSAFAHQSYACETKCAFLEGKVKEGEEGRK